MGSSSPGGVAVTVTGISSGVVINGDLVGLGQSLAGEGEVYIDFGFLVDGPIVILEAVIAALAGHQLVGKARDGAFTEVAGAVARPVIRAAPSTLEQLAAPGAQTCVWK